MTRRRSLPWWGGGGDAESEIAEDGFGVSDDGGAGEIEAGEEGTVGDG